MRVVLKPLSVLIACAGCARGGQVARDAGANLERRGHGELSWLGDVAGTRVLAAKARSRWPLVVLDGCPEACARAWLSGQGITPQRCYMLAGMQAEEAADRVAAER